MKIRYKLVQNNKAPQISVPTKTILLTRETNQLVGTTTDTRTVSVWSESTVLPGEILRALIRRPDGELVVFGGSLFTRVRAGKASTSSSFSWFFNERDGFGEIEAGRATAQIRERFTQRPLALKAFTPLELFCVTNSQGGTLAGYVEFAQFSPAQPDATSKMRVRVQIQNVFGSGPMIGYSAKVPEGYVLRATASEGEAFTHTPAGPYDFNSSWHRGYRPGRAVVYPEAVTWNVPQRNESTGGSVETERSPSLLTNSPETETILRMLPQRTLRSGMVNPGLEPNENQHTNTNAPRAAPITPVSPPRPRIPGRPEFEPFDVVLGEPKLIFTVTNGPGDVYQGFLELVGPTNKTQGVALSDPPSLRFLAWQDEWKTNKPFAAWKPDGSPVTNAMELGWLREVHPGGMDVSNLKLSPAPRFLHLWFSVAPVDRLGSSDASLFDEQGKPVRYDGNNSSSSSFREATDRNGNFGWCCWSLSPGADTNIPSRVTVQMRYTAGPLERIRDVPPDGSVEMSLEGDGQLNGVGQTANGRAFVAFSVIGSKMKSRRMYAVAITKDGRELTGGRSAIGSSNDPGLRSERYEFDVPISGVEKFIIGSRPIRTNEWKNVVLRSN